MSVIPCGILGYMVNDGKISLMMARFHCNDAVLFFFVSLKLYNQIPISLSHLPYIQSSSRKVIPLCFMKL